MMLSSILKDGKITHGSASTAHIIMTLCASYQKPGKYYVFGSHLLSFTCGYAVFMF